MEPNISLTWKQWAAVGAGVFIGLTTIGYVHDNYWDPSKASSRSKPSSFKRPAAPKTQLELDNPGLTGENLIKKIIQLGEHLESQKKHEEAEKYFLRLYDLVKEEAARSPPEVGQMLIPFALHFLVKNYRSQKKWKDAEFTLHEMLSFGEALQEPEYSEWKLSLVDVLKRLRKYPEALEEAEETKKNLQKATDAPGQEGRVQLLQFMVHEKVAEIHRTLGKLSLAEAEMKLALQIASPHTASRALQMELDLACMYLQMNERQKAEATFESLAKRPEILSSKNKFLKRRLIASCYFDANLVETAERLFGEIASETESDESSRTDFEQAQNFLAAIAHERLDSKKARSIYNELKKRADMYAYTTSRYFQTSDCKFTETKKDGADSVKGKWKVVLDIRSFFVKGLPHLKPGHFLVVLVETLEDEVSSSSKEEDESEYVDASGFSLNLKKMELEITQSHLDHDEITIETPEITLTKGKKILIEVQIFSDSSASQSLGIHHQLVCILEKKAPPSGSQMTFTPEMLQQLLLQQQ